MHDQQNICNTAISDFTCNIKSSGDAAPKPNLDANGEKKTILKHVSKRVLKENHPRQT
jgi:hypothetical protein